ncbi:MAG: hypothetical protein CMJ18_16355 [Phycisphaeraceae bacterium]|nr:hypothetical protein [Phycisphaeraceae bacterium]
MARTVPLRRIDRRPGFVVNWLLCGPFNRDGRLTSCAALRKDYLKASGGERRARPRAGERVGRDGPEWSATALREGCIVNLARSYADRGIVSYAMAYLHCPAARPVRLWLGSDDGFVLVVNGRRVAAQDVHRGLGIDSDACDLSLRRGTNAILLKVEQFYGAYEFCLRVTDPDGRGIRGLKAFVDHPRVRRPVDPARSRTISGFEYLSHRFATARLKLAFDARTPNGYRAWRRRFLDQYRKLLGPLPAPCPLRPEVTEDVVVEQLRRRRVLLDFEPGFSFPCYLTVPRRVPRGAKLPALLCLHGHGGGKRDMVGETTPPGAYDPYNIALHAARKGYVTLSPDFLAFGERQSTGVAYGEGQDPCPAEFAWGQMAGVLPTAINIATVRRSIDYLQTLRFVDARRIGAAGHSFGGYMTTMTTAVERRIRAAVISGFMMTSEAYHGRTWTCGSQVVPGLLEYGDLSDIACTFAPRPTLIITGLYDCVAPFPFADAAFRKIERAYRAAGADGRAEQFVFAGEHVFQPEAALQWLDRWI